MPATAEVALIGGQVNALFTATVSSGIQGRSLIVVARLGRAIAAPMRSIHPKGSMGVATILPSHADTLERAQIVGTRTATVCPLRLVWDCLGGFDECHIGVCSCIEAPHGGKRRGEAGTGSGAEETTGNE